MWIDFIVFGGFAVLFMLLAIVYIVASAVDTVIRKLRGLPPRPNPQPTPQPHFYEPDYDYGFPPDFWLIYDESEDYDYWDESEDCDY